ncbi:hypothetical protein AB4853_40215 [Bradyrhizobium sp. 1050_B9_N1_2]|uniref:hypothetical protein n=1 Tax=Bradyrhizobium sp. 1050_B9_N1_2 TaxID=3238688 RepID=UPI003EDC9B6F
MGRHQHDIDELARMECNRVRGRIETIIAKERRYRRSRLPQPRRTYEAVAREASQAAEEGGSASPRIALCRGARLHAGACRRRGQGCADLQFVIFAACRTNEAIEGGWIEIDRPDSIWKIPGHRMKMDQDHHVPLAEVVMSQTGDGESGRNLQDFEILFLQSLFGPTACECARREKST